MAHHTFVDIDLQNENNSQTQQVLLVGFNKTVLEIGPATGYITKELRKRGCRVTCIEKNHKLASIVKRFCEEIIVEDVEQLNFEVLGRKKFDVVLLGSILEHLREPEKVLEKLIKLLKPSGYVVAIIPNIAHGSVRLSLLTGKFEYASNGLLDKTHLRFFTRESMEKMFRKVGLGITEVRDTKLDIFSAPNIKLKQNFPEVLVYSIKQDPEAIVYEFVVKARPLKGKPPSTTKKRKIDPINVLSEKILRGEAIEYELKKEKSKINSLIQENKKLKNEINLIKSSLTWKALRKFSFLIDKLARTLKML